MFKTPFHRPALGQRFLDFGHSCFEFVSDFEIRISDFNMRANRAEATV